MRRDAMHRITSSQGINRITGERPCNAITLCHWHIAPPDPTRPMLHAHVKTRVKTEVADARSTWPRTAAPPAPPHAPLSAHETRPTTAHRAPNQLLKCAQWSAPFRILGPAPRALPGG